MESRFLTDGLDFTCVTKIDFNTEPSDYFCYPISLDAKAAFNKLQRMLNALSSRAGTPLVREDGILGWKTISATLAAFDWVESSNHVAVDPLLARGLYPTYRGPSGVAVHAQALAETFANAAAIHFTPEDIQALFKTGQFQKVADIKTSNIIRTTEAATTPVENQQPTVSTPVIVGSIITIAALFGFGFSLMFRRPNRK